MLLSRSRINIYFIISAFLFVGGLYVLLTCEKQLLVRKEADKPRNTTGIPNILSIDELIYDRTLHEKRNGRIFLKAQNFDTNDTCLKLGRNFAKSRTIAIGGAARNCEKNLRVVKGNLKTMTEFGKNYSLLIVENDSSDNTRKVLLEWKKDFPNMEILGCKNATRPCHIKMKRGHKPGGAGSDERSLDGWRDRVNLMANLRNKYLHRAIELKSDFLISYEMDLQYNLPKNHLEKAFYLLYKYPHIDSLCQYGTGMGNTPWDVCSIVYPPISKWQSFVQGREHQAFVESITRFGGEKQPMKVLSCFGGLAIYRVSSLRKYSARYRPPPDGVTTCEHNMLSYSLKNNYIVPTMKVSFSRNWSE